MTNSNANQNASPAKQGQEIINPRRVSRAAGFVTLGNCCRCGRSLSLSRCNKTGARCSFEGAQYDTEGNFLYDAATKPARHRVERNAQETPREKVQTIAAPAPKNPTATLKHRVRRSPASLGGSFYWLEAGQVVTIYSTSGDAARVAAGDNPDRPISEDFFSISLAHLEMTPPEGLTKEEGFFYEWAGTGYHPEKETEEEGKRRGARELARAERLAKAQGYTFAWQVDPDTDSSEFSDETPAWSVWECRCLNADGKAVAFLGGVDFGRDGSPSSDPYARVVQAEMADELDLEEPGQPEPYSHEEHQEHLRSIGQNPDAMTAAEFLASYTETRDEIARRANGWNTPQEQPAPAGEVPCDCGATTAEWRGDRQGRREYLCAACAAASTTPAPVGPVASLAAAGQSMAAPAPVHTVTMDSTCEEIEPVRIIGSGPTEAAALLHLLSQLFATFGDIDESVFTACAEIAGGETEYTHTDFSTPEGNFRLTTATH